MTLDLLVVEDNPTFMNSALNYFDNNHKLLRIGAFDYDEALEALNSEKFNGAIIDCFFPYKTGSNNTDLGKHAIEKMLSTDITGQRIEEFDSYFSRFMDLENPELKRIVRYIGSQSNKPPEEYKPARAFNSTAKINPKLTAHLLKNYADDYLPGLATFKDYYPALRKAIEECPSNQPLGILIAEECQKKKLPFVLATSTHHHDNLTQPIADYCSRNKWTLIDCPPNLQGEKTTSAFWEGAYEKLLMEMRK